MDPILTPTDRFNLADLAGIWCIDGPGRLDCLLELSSRLPELQRMLSAAGGERSTMENINAGGRNIAVIKLGGVLTKGSWFGTSTVQARRDIRAARQDPKVAGILLAIDSPGGTSSGTAELGDEIRAARQSKPVWAGIEDTGASAAYWAASQADKVFANRTALVGSIGTYQVVEDWSAALDKAGVKVHVFKTGPLKGIGVGGSKLSPEQADHVQKLVNGLQAHFDQAVMTGRRLTAQQLAAVRHGGAMSAEEALQAKLIDGIRPIGETLAELVHHSGAANPPMSAIRTSRSIPTRAIPRLPGR